MCIFKNEKKQYRTKKYGRIKLEIAHMEIIQAMTKKGGVALKKGQVVIFDNDEAYANSFLEYLEEKQGMPFEIVVFTKKEALLDYLEKGKIQILLISSNAMSQEFEDYDVEEIVLLADEEVLSSYIGYKFIYKYQSMENLVRQIVDCYVDVVKESSYMPVTKNKGEIIGIYAPFDSIERVGFGIALAQILSAEDRVLYISMQEFSAFDKIFEINYTVNLSDLMYFYKQSPDSLSIKIKAVTYSMDSVDFIPPLIYSGDLRNIDTEQWLDLIEHIMAVTDYDKIVLEVGQAMKNPIVILESCTSIYIPTTDNSVETCKIKEWEEYILGTGHNDLFDKVYKVSVPKCEPWSSVEEYREKYLWGEAGDCIREFIKGDE